MKVKIIKGPHFEKVQEKAYRYLSKLLTKRAKDMNKEPNNNKQTSQIRFCGFFNRLM